MKKSPAFIPAARLLLVAAATLTLAGCVDDSYDLSKDIDATMALGTEGLQLKLGTTEKIMLADLLEVDDNLKTDAESRYYLVESGETSVDFQVNTVSASIDNAVLHPERTVVTYADIASAIGTSATGSISVPAGFTYAATGVTAQADFGIDFDIPGGDITWIKSVKPASGTKATIKLSLVQNGTNFVLKDVKNLKLTFPAYLHFTNPTAGTIAGNVYTISDQTNLSSSTLDLGEATLDDVVLSGETGKIVNNKLTLGEQYVSMTGDFTLTAAGSFAASASTTANVRLTVSLGNENATQSTLSIASVTGQFAPAINPVIEQINVGDNLPDFLQDDEVAIHVANPTIKFVADMTDVPVGLDLTADLSSVKSGQTIASVALPASGKADVDAAATSTLYFYQGASPFDPAGVSTAAKTYAVPTLSSLITKLPDGINVDVSTGHITAKQEDATVTLGRSYHTQLGYELLVPFTFESGLNIVYTDSVTDMNDDLKDYQAEGAIVTAEIENAVPLDLLASVEPLDVNGKIISGITVTSVSVPAASIATDLSSDAAIAASATTTPVELTMTLSTPALLSQLDRLRFRVNAAAGQSTSTGTLSSKQYIIVKNMRIKLTGNITANFN